MNGKNQSKEDRLAAYLIILVLFLLVIGVSLFAVHVGRQGISIRRDYAYLGLMAAFLVTCGALAFLPFWLRRANGQSRTGRGGSSAGSNLHSFFFRHPRPHLTVDRRGRITSINPAMAIASGESDDSMVGDYFESFTGPRDVAEARRRFQIVLDGRPQLFELECRTSTGTTFLGEISAIPLHDGKEVNGAVCSIRDITQERNDHEELKLTWVAFENADEAILLCDRTFHIIAANRAYMTLTGFDPVDVDGSKPDFLDHGNQAESIGKALEAKGQWAGELYFNTPTGRPILAKASMAVVNGDDHFTDRIVVTLGDLTEIRDLQGEVEYLTMRDPLTGLPNLRAMTSWFESRKAASGDDQRVAVAYIDLHRFRAINSLFGHEVGSKLLTRFGNYLEAGRDENSYVARFQGDEFIYASAQAQGESDLREQIAVIQAALRSASTWNGNHYSVEAHIGVSVFPDHGKALDDLIRAADLAVYEAEHSDDNFVVFFDETMGARLQRKLEIEKLLPQALGNDELGLVYQPILNLEDGRITGAEALLRWENPKLGTVSPGEFIPLAERFGLMDDIGEWILEKACRQAAGWCRKWPHLRHISINISTYQLLRENFVLKVCRHVSENEILRERLVLEITERIIMSDPEKAITVIGELREAGVGVAIDDFGTGYSSLNYLRRLPVKYVKIDRTFVNNILESEVDRHIFRAVIDLSHHLGIKVVAEGVESQDQLEMLRGLDCDEVQGFLIARPTSVDRLVGHFSDRD